MGSDAKIERFGKCLPKVMDEWAKCRQLPWFKKPRCFVGAVGKIPRQYKECGCKLISLVFPRLIPLLQSLGKCKATTPGCQKECCRSIGSKLENVDELVWTTNFTSGSGSSSSDETSITLRVSDDARCEGNETNRCVGSVVSSFKAL